MSYKIINFCTFIKSNYLDRFLLMLDSLEANCSSYNFYLFTDDSIVTKIVSSLNLPNVILVDYLKFGTREISELLRARSTAEGVWMLTPVIIEYCLETIKLSNVTYLDADLYFYSDPTPHIIEFLDSDSDLLLTEHRFPEDNKIQSEKKSGRFCVQFNPFKKNLQVADILDDWKAFCFIDTSYGKDGINGEQKYLEDWPKSYSGIAISEDFGLGVAPWNYVRYEFKYEKDMICVLENNTKKRLIFYHFQNLKILPFGLVNTNLKVYNHFLINRIYKPYVEMLINKRSFLKEEYDFNNYTYSGFHKSRFLSFLRAYVIPFRIRNIRTIFWMR
jgi:hypothetical protein